jgi:hypothetical protein
LHKTNIGQKIACGVFNGNLYAERRTEEIGEAGKGIKEIRRETVDWINLAWTGTSGSCGHGNKLSESIRGRDFIC